MKNSKQLKKITYTTEQLDYRGIANVMTKSGDKMNHSTARNIFLRGMNQVTAKVTQDVGAYLDDRKIDKLSRNKHWQTTLASVLRKDG